MSEVSSGTDAAKDSAKLLALGKYDFSTKPKITLDELENYAMKLWIRHCSSAIDNINGNYKTELEQNCLTVVYWTKKYRNPPPEGKQDDQYVKEENVRQLIIEELYRTLHDNVELLLNRLEYEYADAYYRRKEKRAAATLGTARNRRASMALANVLSPRPAEAEAPKSARQKRKHRDISREKYTITYGSNEDVFYPEDYVRDSYWTLISDLIGLVLDLSRSMPSERDREFYAQEIENILSTSKDIHQDTEVAYNQYDSTGAASSAAASPSIGSSPASQYRANFEKHLYYATLIAGLCRLACHALKINMEQLLCLDSYGGTSLDSIVASQKPRLFHFPNNTRAVLDGTMARCKDRLKYCTSYVRHLRSVAAQYRASADGSATQRPLDLLLLTDREKKTLLGRNPVLFCFNPLFEELEDEWETFQVHSFQFLGSTMAKLMTQTDRLFWTTRGVKTLQHQNLITEHLVELFSREIRPRIEASGMLIHEIDGGTVDKDTEVAFPEIWKIVSWMKRIEKLVQEYQYYYNAHNRT